MKYWLSDYDRAKFDRINDLVRLCYQNPVSGKWVLPGRNLDVIQTTEKDLFESDVEYIHEFDTPEDQLNGVCFHRNAHSNFAIWMNPALEPGSLLHELTLIHELCHGYQGPGMHGRAWRRYFGISVVMYSQLINPEFTDASWQVRHTIRRYRSEEQPSETYSVFNDGCNFECEAVDLRVERNIDRVQRDLSQLQEMRQSCQRFSSNSTPTPAYLASLPRKAGTASPLT